MAGQTPVERLLDLEIERLNAGLDAEAQAELEALRQQHPDVEAADYELASAAIELATLEVEPMPATLAERLRADGQAFLSPEPVPLAHFPSPAAQPASPRSPVWWAAALAASLLLAIFGWLRPTFEPDGVPVGQRVEAEQVRRQFLEDARTQLIELAATEDPAAIEAGDVTWSQDRQHGFLRLVGLPVNDPSEYQYQLWIIDGAREGAPVDGGVFDISASDINDSGEVVLPIDAKLAVRQPAAFAITIEKPGGVVVSAQDRVVAIGKVG